jgi:hypothetical protein
MTEPMIEQTDDEAEDFTDELSDEALDQEKRLYWSRCGCL